MLHDAATARRGFELLVRQYSEPLYWQIRRFVHTHDDADDLLQNTFMKAWVNLNQYHGESKLLTWLSRIAINESLDFLRSRQRRPAIADDDPQSLAAQLQADPYFSGSETEALLQEAIAQLPEVQRTVFLLRYYDELPYREIHQRLGTSEGALKASYHIAVQKITEFFKSRD